MVLGFLSLIMDRSKLDGLESANVNLQKGAYPQPVFKHGLLTGEVLPILPRIVSVVFAPSGAHVREPASPVTFFSVWNGKAKETDANRKFASTDIPSWSQ